jgi:hypothetical protein
MHKIILFALLLSTLNLQAKSLFSNNEQAENAKYINSLKDLVIATQKTRGLTNSYLNGNESTLLLIHGNKQDMKRALGIMESLPLSSNSVISERATDISQSLVRLNNRAFKLKPTVAFDAYTEQIEQTLMLAQTVSKQGSKDLNRLGQEASVLMMETILPLTEQIGRMRGMGSGIIAKGKISKNQKYSMIAMINNINKINEKLQKDMKFIVANNKDSYDSTIHKNLALSQKSILKYTTLTKSKVLSAKGKLNADDYFAQGTDIISLLVNIFNSNNQAIIKDSKGWI